MTVPHLIFWCVVGLVYLYYVIVYCMQYNIRCIIEHWKTKHYFYAITTVLLSLWELVLVVLVLIRIMIGTSLTALSI